MDLYNNKNVQILQYGDSPSELSLQRSKYIIEPNPRDTSYIIKEGDKLDYLAYLFYEDASLWFFIADANDIENPLELEVGSKIIIPNIKPLLL